MKSTHYKTVLCLVLTFFLHGDSFGQQSVQDPEARQKPRVPAIKTNTRVKTNTLLTSPPVKNETRNRVLVFVSSLYVTPGDGAHALWRGPYR